jgi:hypothetical protein
MTKWLPIFLMFWTLRAASSLAQSPPAKADAQNVTASQPPAPTVVDRVRFFPAPQRAMLMVGGKITGSNVSPTEGFSVLAEIASVPKAADWTELQFANKTPYRWVRYEAPPGSRGNIAELEFYAGSRKLSGRGFGSPGAQPPGGSWKTAFDSKIETFFNTAIPDGQYVGLDLEDQASTGRVRFSSAGKDLAPQVVTLRSSTPGATIRYTLDGSPPGPDGGILYTEGSRSKHGLLSL